MKNIIIVSLGLFYLLGCSAAPQAPTSLKGKVKAGEGEANPDKGSEIDDLGSDSSDNGDDTVSTPGGDDTAMETPTTETPTTETPTTEPPKTETPEEPKVSAPLSADLMAKSSQSTKVSSTPMGRWFQNAVKVKASDADMKFLEDPNQNVPAVKGWVYKKFNVNLYPSNGKPHPADGMQTAIGDCNMLAMLNSFAYQHPDFLKGLIKDKGNGTFEVQMFNPQQERITVALNSEFLADGNGNLVTVRGTGGGAVWITVMEKAIMKYNHIFKIWNGDGPAKVEGFGSEAGSPMLTGEGNSYAFDRGALKSKEDLTRAVKEALAAGKLITGGFGQVLTMNGLKSVTGHAYTVMVPANNNVMISMRNPWGVSPKASGGNDGSHDGILDISYDDSWFKTIDIRVMEPGIAGVTGNTGPYQPRFNFVDAGFTAADMAFQAEMHLKYGSR